MRTLYLVLFFTISYAQLLAQNTASISGTLKTSDGSPAEFVNLTLKGTHKGTVADKNGNYEILNVSPGSYTLVASFVGLEAQEQKVEIKAGEKQTINFTLKENSQQLQEIVISGSRDSYKTDELSSSLRLRTPLLEVPQNIQVVTSDMLSDQQVISMSDGLIRNISGTIRMEHWGDMYTNIASRGSQVQAFRNGFNVVNSYWGPLTEDMSFVDHIEFVKGPAGFMLSSGDPSGLYNVVTKKPTGQTSQEVSLTYGSYNLMRGTVDLDGKLSKDGKFLYRLNMAAQKKETHRDREFNDRYTFAPVISYQLNSKTKLTAEYTLQYAKMSDVGSYYIFSPDGLATYPVDFTLIPEGLPDTKITDHSTFFNMEHKLNDSWKVTAQYSYINYYHDGTSMWPDSVAEDGTMIRATGVWESRSNMHLAQMFINGDFVTGDINHRVLGGLDYGNKDYKADWSQSHALDTEEQMFDPRHPDYGPPPNGYPQFDYSTPLTYRATEGGGIIDQQYWALYVQDELGLFENRLRVTVAGRYTSLEQSEWGDPAKSADRLTPRVGLSASLSKSTALYALYDQAFTPQAGKLSNGDKVRPITGNNVELGLKRDWFGGRWNTTFAIYSILKNNELVADPSKPANSGLSIELGQKRSQGIEFDVRGTVARGLNLTANYALTDSRVIKVNDTGTGIEEDDIVPGYAKHTANAWLSYKIQRGVLKGSGISGGFTYLAGRETYWDPSPPGGAVLPNYFKVDGGLFWENRSFKVTANVFNVLDKYLYNGSYYFWLNAYNWQTDAPRNFRLSVNYRF